MLPFPEYYWRRTRRSVSVIDQPAARPVYGQFSLGYGPILIGFIAGLIELKRQQHPRGASVSHGNVVLQIRVRGIHDIEFTCQSLDLCRPGSPRNQDGDLVRGQGPLRPIRAVPFVAPVPRHEHPSLVRDIGPDA